MMKAAASTWPKPSGSGMHSAAGASVWVPKPPVPDRQATFWPTFRCVTPSPTACDDAGVFGARHEGQGRLHLVLVLHDQQVGKVQARRLDLDQHLARAGRAASAVPSRSARRRRWGFRKAMRACSGLLRVGHVRAMNAGDDRWLRQGGACPCCDAPGAYNLRALQDTMKILISNDDGFQAPGIVALHDALKDIAEVEVVAPEHNNSAKSNALTLAAPLYVHKAHNGFRYVTGTPADCVHIALKGLLDYRPDLVVSGINNGANMGDDTIYSGHRRRGDGGLPVRRSGHRVLADREGLGPCRCRLRRCARRLVAADRTRTHARRAVRSCSTSTCRTGRSTS